MVETETYQGNCVFSGTRTGPPDTQSIAKQRFARAFYQWNAPAGVKRYPPQPLKYPAQQYQDQNPNRHPHPNPVHPSTASRAGAEFLADKLVMVESFCPRYSQPIGCGVVRPTRLLISAASRTGLRTRRHFGSAIRTYFRTHAGAFAGSLPPGLRPPGHQPRCSRS